MEKRKSGGQPKITGDIVRDYLKVYNNLPAMTLAKKIYAENSEVYNSVEHVRVILRNHFGQNGNLSRSSAKMVRNHFREARTPNPYYLPVSFADEWKPYHIPKELNYGLIFSDVHLPYHDNKAITAMLDHTAGRTVKPKFILMNGDIIDCYSLSKFVSDPRKRDMNDEIWDLVEFINILHNLFPEAKIIWKFGNHELRYEKWTMVKAPQLLNMQEHRLSEIVKIRGIEGLTVIEKDIIYAGRLPILHGDELQGGATSPVNPARGLALKTMSSSMVSHHHKTSSHSDKDINDKLMSWWSIGCLCGLHPEYARVNKWNHGFAYIETDGLEFSIDNYKIYNDKVYKD